MMKKAPLYVTIGVAIATTILALRIGGMSGLLWAIIPGALLTALAGYAAYVYQNNRSPGKPTINLSVGLTASAVAILIISVIVAAAYGNRGKPEQVFDRLPVEINEDIVVFADELAEVQGLTTEQRVALTALVPEILPLDASKSLCQAADAALAAGHTSLRQFILQNERARDLAVASVPDHIADLVNWEAVYVAEVERLTLYVDNQLRQVLGSGSDIVFEPIGTQSTVTINPAAHPNAVWYVGLPLSGITAQDKYGQGYRGYFKTTATSPYGMEPEFVLASSCSAISKWIPLRSGRKYQVDGNGSDYGLFVQWRGEELPNAPFTINAAYETEKWPTHWRVRIRNIPPNVDFPITTVPTQWSDVPGWRIDSLVSMIITTTDGRCITQQPTAEVAFGSTVKVMKDPFVQLTTTGENNPGLAIRHFYADKVNVDITFLPRSKSEL